jgi:membrane protease YdiL (CAAX protease family)
MTNASRAPGLLPDAAVFLGGGGLLFGVVHWGVPKLAATGLDPFAAYMLLSVPLIFIPIIAGGLLLLRSEGGAGPLLSRLRLGRPSGRDWLWAVAGIVAIGAGSVMMKQVCNGLGLSTDPFARPAQAWTAEQWWMFAVWAIYWPFNILGEEFAWRGVILPRMEARVGGLAWCLNAALWAAFHLGFGVGTMLLVAPALLLVPLLSQRRRNTWIGVVLHAGLSLPGMAAIAFGLI